MLKLESLKAGMSVKGLLAGAVVKVIAATPAPDGSFTTVVYQAEGSGGQGPQFGQAMLYRSQEADLEEVASGPDFSGDPDRFKLAVEAKRIQLAYLFDPMMAVSSSAVMPLPHQITAVYEAMLPKQPIRFLLADDPGAGKTIMAGLLIKELAMRGDAQRVLIVAPGSLAAQWQDELREKFGLAFEIFSRAKLEEAGGGNPFKSSGFWIVRLDQFSRTDPVNYQGLVSEIDWDLVVIDEAHKVAAHYNGKKVEKTQRFKFAELLSRCSRHFLMMTATPHNGKEEDFQLFLSLIDPDRFYGKAEAKLGAGDLRDVMRRMVKEDMLKFDGKRLFPERMADTVGYRMSPAEASLYQDVTSYVREEMNRAEKVFNESKRTVVGFALTLLQRRLASSPEAIYQSLARRRKRLEELLEEWKQHPERIERSSQKWLHGLDPDEYDEDDFTEDEAGRIEEDTQSVTAAKSIAELSAEIFSLGELEKKARAVRDSGKDSKWSSLSDLLQSESPDGRPLMDNKLIIFTEHKDTLTYLVHRISGLCGNPRAVVAIHGGIGRDERRRIQDAFRNDPEVRYLIATDAAGEGINLQNTNYMINYDLPWNPNRIEQRFGRIHRIGQQEVCHLYNLVARDTREGQVFERLFAKLQQQKQDLGDRVFDVLGDLFENGASLKDVLVDSIRDDQEKKKRFLLERIDSVFDGEHIREVVDRNALCKSDFGGGRLLEVKNRMEEAEARRLQPCYVRDFFKKGMTLCGGVVMTREKGRLQVKRVPPEFLGFHAQSRDGLSSRQSVSRAYERVCFSKEGVDPETAGARLPRGELLHPGHPLMQALIADVSKRCGDDAARGTILVDGRDDAGTEPRLLALLELGVRESGGERRVAARKMLFLSAAADGSVSDAGPAPHLDLRPMTEEEKAVAGPDLASAARQCAPEGRIQAEAARLSQTFFEETLEARKARVQHERIQVEERLKGALQACDDRIVKIRMKKVQGKLDPANLQRLSNQAAELKDRLRHRLARLEAEEKLLAEAPRLCGEALVVPRGYFLKRLGRSPSEVDVQARKRVEMIAMDAVAAAERAIGNEPRDCSAQNKGWDIESTVPATGEIRRIEVKGVTRKPGGREQVTVSRNEWLQGYNLGENFILACVVVEGDAYDAPLYVRNPFRNEPDDGDTQKSMELSYLSQISKSAGEA